MRETLSLPSSYPSGLCADIVCLRPDNAKAISSQPSSSPYWLYPDGALRDRPLIVATIKLVNAHVHPVIPFYHHRQLHRHRRCHQARSFLRAWCHDRHLPVLCLLCISHAVTLAFCSPMRHHTRSCKLYICCLLALCLTSCCPGMHGYGNHQGNRFRGAPFPTRIFW